MDTNEIENPSLSEIFKDIIKVDPKPMSIENLFLDEKRFSKTNYKPDYQRNYVWDDEKATYFIESILLGTEIPPLIFFDSEEKMEVVDGRQRYETIKRFVKNEFKLKKNGLRRLRKLANHSFDQLSTKLQDDLWDTKLRLIVFSLRSTRYNRQKIEEIVKLEVFKRYNSGITPLKNVEIAKAKYVHNPLNTYFDKNLSKDERTFKLTKSVFCFNSDKDIQKLFKIIRRLLVLDTIPISYFAIKKDKVSELFFEELSRKLNTEEMQSVYGGFVRKINLISEYQNLLEDSNIPYNRLISECMYWAFCILEKEGVNFNNIKNSQIKVELVEYLKDNIDPFLTKQILFTPEIEERFSVMANFFEKEFNVSYKKYLKNDGDFIAKNRQLLRSNFLDDAGSFEEIRINKPDPSSNTINDLLRQMYRQRFLLRPSYQREEVINKVKSSAIIESILLDIKLPPIFIFKRKDGIQEVVDGQQRLLSILGFIGKEYLDENGKFKKSEKNEYRLNLKNGILKDWHGKTYNELPANLQSKLQEHELWVVEINEKTNPGFDPDDLFIRLNDKPYPIKENTFEMWNSYVDKDLIRRIKGICESYTDWFYLRIDNSRMNNEELITYLVYLQYCSLNLGSDFEKISSFLGVYKAGSKISVRIKSKSDVTKILKSTKANNQLLEVCHDFENNFIKKIQTLVFETNNDTDVLKERFDSLLNVKRSSRTMQDFYTLWFILSNVSLGTISVKRNEITKDIHALFVEISKISNKEDFKALVTKFWNKYQVS